ncbi:LuxR C-terminal-related transcriptional regulator [Andreprevotia chitinilytica]|uniref:LuxR C-terminal-related transcriptional regulator n=1 Tax=Andreprevotia chitinilytica TaxID=396808 RepID=UPI0005578F3D|nr:response regulator transcription factor [Andreprevotia chitinilytica]
MKALLIDDHALFRDGVALLITHEFPRWQLLQAGNLAQAQACLDQHPDIALVLLDLGLPDNEGLEGLALLREHAPACAYVVMSAKDTRDTILAAIEQGAAGFIPKTSQTGTMLSALRTVLGGQVYLPPLLIGTAPPPAEPGQLASSQLGLSPRQADVLRLLIEGRSNKEICRALGIAESTVKTHLDTIFRKLDANSRTQAVVAAARMGLRLDPPQDQVA